MPEIRKAVVGPAHSGGASSCVEVVVGVLEFMFHSDQSTVVTATLVSVTAVVGCGWWSGRESRKADAARRRRRRK